MQPPLNPFPDPPAPAGRHRILVVDDEPGFTRLLRINLEATGRYAVQEVNDSLDALSIALDFHPDLVLLDVMMPGMDGGDVASQFSNDARLREIPTIFLTATVRHSEVDANHGCFGGLRFISKPIALPELLACLDAFFAGMRAHATA